MVDVLGKGIGPSLTGSSLMMWSMLMISGDQRNDVSIVDGKDEVHPSL